MKWINAEDELLMNGTEAARKQVPVGDPRWVKWIYSIIDNPHPKWHPNHVKWHNEFYAESKVLKRKFRY